MRPPSHMPEPAITTVTDTTFTDNYSSDYGGGLAVYDAATATVTGSTFTDNSSYEHGGVTFRHHEAVGARMTRKRLTALGYPEAVVEDVSELVRLSGRFKGYAEGWTEDMSDELEQELHGLVAEIVRGEHAPVGVRQ